MITVRFLLGMNSQNLNNNPTISIIVDQLVDAKGNPSIDHIVCKWNTCWSTNEWVDDVPVGWTEALEAQHLIVIPTPCDDGMSLEQGRSRYEKKRRRETFTLVLLPSAFHTTWSQNSWWGRVTPNNIRDGEPCRLSNPLSHGEMPQRHSG